MRWPPDASLDRATPSTAKTGKPHRDLTQMRRDGMVSIVFHMTDATTVLGAEPSGFGLARQ
jgi:hypothetical protein